MDPLEARRPLLFRNHIARTTLKILEAELRLITGVPPVLGTVVGRGLFRVT